MSKNLLNTYFEGLTRQIQAELDYMNDIISHAGEKGRANENIIKDMLIKFLPSKYNVGSGIIINKLGNYSSQCDIVIYDKEYHPDFFGQRSAVLFPVEMVYAVIEVKTNLGYNDIRDAVKYIQSVKKLEFIKKQIRVGGSYQMPTSPLGIIFAYDTDYKTMDGWKQHFISSIKNIDVKAEPDLGLILKKGLLFYKKGSKYQLEYSIFGDLPSPEVNKFDSIELYPVKAFLKFLSFLLEKLKKKHIIQDEIFSEYLDKNYFNSTII